MKLTTWVYNDGSHTIKFLTWSVACNHDHNKSIYTLDHNNKYYFRHSKEHSSAEYTTAEYSTLVDLTSELRLAVRPELISLTGSLLASRLISPDNDIELRDTAHSGEVRSARLVELVQNKVRQNPRHYHSFTGILQGNENQYRDILQQLEQAYQEQRSQDGNYDNYQWAINDHLNSTYFCNIIMESLATTVCRAYHLLLLI